MKNYLVCGQKKKPTTTPYVPIKIKQRKPSPVVIQPPGAYPRFSFYFIMRKPNGKKCRMFAAAYTTELAIEQCKSLCYIFRYDYIKVKKLKRINWDGYNPKYMPWQPKAVKAYKASMEK